MVVVVVVAVGQCATEQTNDNVARVTAAAARDDDHNCSVRARLRSRSPVVAKTLLEQRDRNHFSS